MTKVRRDVYIRVELTGGNRKIPLRARDETRAARNSNPHVRYQPNAIKKTRPDADLSTGTSLAGKGTVFPTTARGSRDT